MVGKHTWYDVCTLLNMVVHIIALFNSEFFFFLVISIDLVYLV